MKKNTKPLRVEDILGSEGILTSENRGQNASLRIVLLLSVFGITAILLSFSAFAYEIVGNTVIMDNSKANIKITPHTLKARKTTVEYNLTSKIFSGDVNFALGTDGELFRLSNPSYNGEIGRVKHDYMGMDTWYYIKNVPIQQNKEYSLKFDVETLNPNADSKFWVCAWRSDEGIASAISNDRIYCIDPWANQSYGNASVYFLTNPYGKTLTNTAFELSLNVSLFPTANGCNDFEFGNETAFFDFYNLTDCVIGGANTTFLVEFPIITPDNTTEMMIYYNNSDDTTFDVDITGFLFGDDFEDNDITDWVHNGVFDMLTASSGVASSVTGGYMYNNGQTGGTSATYELPSALTTESFAIYFTCEEKASNGYIGIGIGQATQQGYWTFGCRTANDDIIVYRDTATIRAQDGEAWNQDTIYENRLVRHINGTWAYTKDGVNTGWATSNNADQTYNSTLNISVLLRKDDNRLYDIIVTQFCYHCSFLFNQTEENGTTPVTPPTPNATNNTTLSVEIMYCQENGNLFIRSKDIAENGTAVFNEYEYYCQYGCSNESLLHFGNAGCIESNFVESILAFALPIAYMLILIWMVKK